MDNCKHENLECAADLVVWCKDCGSIGRINVRDFEVTDIPTYKFLNKEKLRLERANNLLRQILNRRPIGGSVKDILIEEDDLFKIRVHLKIKLDGSEDFNNTGRRCECEVHKKPCENKATRRFGNLNMCDYCVRRLSS